MIVQNILDWFSRIVADLVGLIPPLPPEWAQLAGDAASAGAQLGAVVSKLSPIIPFGTITTLLGVWVAIIGFWVVIQGVRTVLWLVNR